MYYQDNDTALSLYQILCNCKEKTFSPCSVYRSTLEIIYLCFLKGFSFFLTATNTFAQLMMCYQQVISSQLFLASKNIECEKKSYEQIHTDLHAMLVIQHAILSCQHVWLQ